MTGINKKASMVVDTIKALPGQFNRIKNYYKEIASAPVKGVKSLFNVGSMHDPRTRLETVGNAINEMIANAHVSDTALVPLGHGPVRAPGRATSKVMFDSLENSPTTPIGKLRQGGWLANRRRATGTLSPEQQQKIVSMLREKGLLHTQQTGQFAVHRDAYKNMKDLEDIYQKIHTSPEFASVGPHDIVDSIRNTFGMLPLPGDRTMNLLPAVGGTLYELRDTETPEGRHRGKVERGIRAGAQLGANLALGPLNVYNKQFGNAAPWLISQVAPAAIHKGLNAVSAPFDYAHKARANKNVVTQ